MLKNMAFTDFIGLIIYLALNTDLASELVLNSVKQSRTVYPMHVQTAFETSSVIAMF
jgi:hypothetical protein